MSSSLCMTLARPNRSGERRNAGGGGRTRIRNSLVFFGFARDVDAGGRAGLILRCLCSCSEKFMVKLNKNGGPKNPEKVDRLCALFTVTQLPVWTMNKQWCSGALRSGYTPFYKQPMQQRINALFL